MSDEAERDGHADEDRRWSVPVFGAAPVSTPLLSIVPSRIEPITPGEALPFSAAGVKELKIRLDEYLDELLAESRRIARRHQADVVSPYVREAGAHAGTARRQRAFALAGSLFLGAAFPGLVDVASGTTRVAWSIVLGMIGASLITVQLLRG